MRNHMKTMLKIIVLSAFILFGATNVYAKVGEVIKIDKKTYVSFNANRKEAKFYTKAYGYGWCITPNKVGAEQGAKLTFKREETDGGLLYLLDNSKTDDTSYLISQIALWKYYNNYTPDIYAKNSKSSVVSSASSLAARANKNKNYTTDPAISISNNSANMTLKTINNNDYYVSQYFTVTLKNSSSYIVNFSSAPQGTVIIDTNGNVRYNFKNGEKFAVRVPYGNVSKSTTFDVVARTSGVHKFVERYVPSNSKNQDIVVLRRENKTVKASRKMVINFEKKVCEVYNGKYYGKNGSVVTEAEYRNQCLNICEIKDDKYYGKDGSEVSEDEYKDQCLNICEVKDDKYYGKDGSEVSEDEYKSQCLHTCEYFDGKYFDLNGSVVSELEYKTQCFKHTCEFFNGNYYDKDGNVTTEDEYNSQCTSTPAEIAVPSTGSKSTPMGMTLLFGVLPLFGGLGLILKNKKFI